jgi:GTP-binding protein
VAVLLVDAREGVTDQDAHLLGHVLDAGRALVIAANKWDGLEPAQRDRARRELERRFAFVDFASVHLISALHGTGVGHLFGSVDQAHGAATRKLSTPALTRHLQEAVAAHPPPLVRGRRIKLRYAHQGGSNPPVVVVHGNQTGAVPDSYRRYLVRHFREAFRLQGTPVRVEFRTGENPYQGRRNTLTPRQQRRRKRLLRHVKR